MSYDGNYTCANTAPKVNELEPSTEFGSVHFIHNVLYSFCFICINFFLKRQFDVKPS